MCLPLVFFVLQVLTLECATAYSNNDYTIAYIPIEEFAYITSMQMEVIPLPYYGNILLDPQCIRGTAYEEIYSSYYPTTGPVIYGSQPNTYENQGFATYSYSPPPTPIVVNSQPTLPTTTTLPDNPTLPPTTTLTDNPTLPPTTLPVEDTMSSVVTVPETSAPVNVETTSVETNIVEADNIVIIDEVDVRTDVVQESSVPVARTGKFYGTVPASGRVKIYGNYYR